MRVRLLLIVTVGLLVAAQGKDDAKKKPANLDGTWVPVSMERDGKGRPDEELKKTKLVIAGGKITVHDGERKEEATYKVDATKKPMTIDITPATGPDKEKDVEGIYTLEGDTLKLCFGRPGTGRPKEFVSKEGSNTMLIVLKKGK